MKRIMFVIVLVVASALVLGSPGLAEEITPPTPEGYPKPVAYPWLVLDIFSSSNPTEDEDGIILEPRIVGGSTYTPENKYPWIVSLQYNGQHYCGGTLIDAQWVLTSAHCWTNIADGSIFQPHPDLDRAVLGEYQLSVDTGHEQSIAISAVYTHPNYNWQTFQNDLALLKLSQAAAINDYVQTIGVASERPADFTSGVITGWGATYYTGPSPLDFVREASIKILPDSSCSSYGVAFDPTNMLCGGVPDFSRDTCQGDSGGALFYDAGGQFKVTGVTSWGYQCATDGFPGVYAKVSSALSWLDSIAGIFGISGQATTIYAPTNTITDDPSPEYQWAHLDIATLYKLAIKNSNNVIIIWKTYNAADICSGSLCAIDPGIVLANGDYTVWVLPTIGNINGKWTSKPFSVDVFGDFPPGAAMIYYPIGTIADSTPDFEWEHLGNATQYKLAVKNPSKTVLIWKIYNAADICSGSFCKAAPNSYLANGDYSVFILPTNNLGNGTWTAVDFSINSKGDSPPGATVIYAPIDTISDPTPEYQWKHLSNATQYKLAVKDQNKTVLIWKVYSAGSICNSSICSVDPGIALPDGDYSVWVLPTNSYGNGIWVSRYFTID